MSKEFLSYGMIIDGHFCKKIRKAGKYSLAIADGDEKILDYVYFEVRGPEADPNVLSGDGEGTLRN
ncbi:MAG: hypothetical protein ACXWMF_06210 [Syntrophales bacterium]